MAKTAVLLGAGSGLGSSVARRLGREGYQVALVGRRLEPLTALAQDLTKEGIVASAFPADAADLAAQAVMFDRVRHAFGAVDLLYFGLTNPAGFVPAVEVTPQVVQTHMDVITHPAIAAVQNVLPEMVDRGEGTILYVSGMSGVHGLANLSGPGPAAAAARNWVHALHAELAAKGVYVGALWIAAMIEGSAAFTVAQTDQGRELSFPTIDPDLLASTLWAMSQERAQVERLVPEFQP